MSVRLCTELFYCGVGTVVAVEATYSPNKNTSHWILLSWDG